VFEIHPESGGKEMIDKLNMKQNMLFRTLQCRFIADIERLLIRAFEKRLNLPGKSW
jgi:hypothetical protein